MTFQLFSKSYLDILMEPLFQHLLSLYSIKLYIGITDSVSWASSTCVLFISIIQLVNGAQFLKITFLFLLFSDVSCFDVSGTVIVPLTVIYASLYSRKFDLIIEVLNLIWLLTL